MKTLQYILCGTTIFFMLFFSVQTVFANSDPPKKYVVTQWGMNEGLPQSSVNDILQSRDGYLWLATFGGLVRFDGVAFTTFDRFNTNGMRSDRILSLYEDVEGNIWCSTEDGFLRFKNGECTPYFITQQSQTYAPLKVSEDSRGVLWITANETPYRFSNNSFVKESILTDALLAKQALQDTGGTWIAHGKEVLRTIGDSVVRILDFRHQLKNNIQDFIEYPEHSGKFWMATNGDGVVRYADGVLSFFAESEGLSSKFVRKLYVDRKNSLWVNCYNGISKWNGKSFDPLKDIPKNTDLHFNGILEDTEGNYWVGTPERGLLKLQPALITTIGNEHGLLNEKMLSLTTLKNGMMLFATNCGGIYEWNGSKAVPSRVNAFLPNLCVWSIFEDSKRRIWFGSRMLYRSRI